MIRDDAPVYAQPDERSKVIARVSYDVLRAGGAWSGLARSCLTEGEEKSGLLTLRRPSTARAYLKKITGVWKLTITESMD